MKRLFVSNSYKHKLKKKGCTPEQWASIVRRQRGKCAICGAEPRGCRRLDLDHSHKTGKLRGLLCSSCNRGIGFLKDSILLLSSAITYLERHRQ